MATYTMVDRSTCIACGACNPTAPGLFEYTEDGLSYALLDGNEGITEVPEELVEDLEWRDVQRIPLKCLTYRFIVKELKRVSTRNNQIDNYHKS